MEECNLMAGVSTRWLFLLWIQLTVLLSIVFKEDVPASPFSLFELQAVVSYSFQVHKDQNGLFSE